MDATPFKSVYPLTLAVNIILISSVIASFCFISSSCKACETSVHSL